MTPQLLHQFLIIIGFLFVLGLVLMFLVWEFAHRAGRNEERAELMPRIGVLESNNERMKLLLDAGPRRYQIASAEPAQRALPPGTEYTATHKWKTAPESVGKAGE